MANQYEQLATAPVYGQTTPVVESALPTPPITPPTPAGGTPVAKPVSVISKDLAEKDYAKKNAEMLKTVQEMQARLGVIQTSADKLAEEERQAKLAEQNAPADTTAKDLETLGITPEKTLEQQQAEVVASFDKEIADVNAKMDQWLVVNNSQTQAMIANIQAQYEERKRQVSDIYMRQEKSMEQLNLRTGVSRYGGAVGEGIITAVEQKKQQELSALDVEQQGLIADIQRASSENEFRILSQKMSQIQANRDKATESLKELQSIALQKNQETEQRLETVKRQEYILRAIQGGMTNAGDIALQYGMDINEVGSVLDIVLESEKQSNETLLPAYNDINGNRILPLFDPITGTVREITLGQAELSLQQKNAQELDLYRQKAGIDLQTSIAKGQASATQEVSELKNNALTSAKELLSKFATSKIAVGGSSLIPVIPGTKTADFVVQFENLKSLLSLDNVKYLKGQGQVSDAERKLLEQASAKLSRKQSEQEFEKSLKEIITALSGGSENNTGQTSSGLKYTIEP